MTNNWPELYERLITNFCPSSKAKQNDNADKISTQMIKAEQNSQWRKKENIQINYG